MNKSVTAAKGFIGGGVSCGVKRSGNLDLGLIVCPGGAKAVGVFTTNKIVSAGVTISKVHVKTSKIYAAVVNSGNANACTGKKGYDDAISMCHAVAEQVGCDPHGVLVASTGIIGEHLPIGKITAGLETVYGKLGDGAAAGKRFAEAIMTTDTKPKQASRVIKIGSKEVVIGGTAKGAGMIGPNMATTICVITTDMAISKVLLQRALRESIGNSLNRLTVDGHQSTNDTAFLMASGAAGNKMVSKQDASYKKFAKALNEVCVDLAEQMALDAEGATRMFKVVIKGAASKADAFKAARAVADYDLVKCAINGGDPNWGRIVCAVGSCGVELDAEKLSCEIGNIKVFAKGQPTKFDAKKVSKIISAKKHTISVGLGAGKHTDFCFGCDLSRDYVTINADYHT